MVCDIGGNLPFPFCAKVTAETPTNTFMKRMYELIHLGIRVRLYDVASLVQKKEVSSLKSNSPMGRYFVLFIAKLCRAMNAMSMSNAAKLSFLNSFVVF